MLFEMLDNVLEAIDSLDAEDSAEDMMQMIDQVRPDFRMEIARLLKSREDDAQLCLVVKMLARGVVLQIKQLPSYIEHLASVMQDESRDLPLRCGIGAVLAYLVQPNNLIDGSAPGGYGFLDDSAIVRAGFIECMASQRGMAKRIEEERQRIQCIARLVPWNVIQPLQLAVNGLSSIIQLLQTLDSYTLSFILQQTIFNPLAGSQSPQAGGFAASSGPNLGEGRWSGGVYTEGENIIMAGGPSLINGELFIPS